MGVSVSRKREFVLGPRLTVVLHRDLLVFLLKIYLVSSLSPPLTDFSHSWRLLWVVALTAHIDRTLFHLETIRNEEQNK